MRKSEEIYKIVYYCDEIGIKPTLCLQSWNCVCYDPFKETDTKCGYPLEEAKQRVIKYYEDKLNYLKDLSNEEFLRSMGIYFD